MAFNPPSIIYNPSNPDKMVVDSLMNLNSALTSHFNSIADSFKTNLILDELIEKITNSTLEIGVRYFITDKDWLLYANTISSLKPVSGSLHIFNGQEVPQGIEPDILFIDTGNITDVANTQSGVTSIDFTSLLSYAPTKLFCENLSDTVAIDTFGLLVNSVGIFTIETGEQIAPLSLFSIDHAFNKSFTLSDNYTLEIGGNGDNGAARIILECHRLKLSVSVPTLSILRAEFAGPEYNGDGNVIVTFNNNVVIKGNEGSPDFGFAFGFTTNGTLNSLPPVVLNGSPNKILLERVSEVLGGDTNILYFNTGDMIICNSWGGVLDSFNDYLIPNNFIDINSHINSMQTDDGGEYISIELDKAYVPNLYDSDTTDFIHVNVNDVETNILQLIKDPNLGDRTIKIKMPVMHMEDIITVSIDDKGIYATNDSTNGIESIPNGYVEKIDNYPVINNITGHIPHLLSAETNTDGSEITFTFDLEMLEPRRFNHSFIIYKNEEVQDIAYGGYVSADNCWLLEDTHKIKLILPPTNNWLFADTLTADIGFSTAISVFGGMMTPVTGISITNNLPFQPIPHLLSAETDSTGNEVMLTFDLAMKQPATVLHSFIITRNGMDVWYPTYELQSGWFKIKLTLTNSTLAKGNTIGLWISANTAYSMYDGALAALNEHHVTNNIV